VSARPLATAALPWAVALGVVLALPWLFPGRAATSLLNQAGITVIFALSYNVLLGQGGMLSFGHAVYSGLGGFAAIHALARVAEHGWPVPLPLLPLAGGLAALAMAALVGLFALRRAGTAFAMISLGIGELVAAAALIFVVFLGGEEGVTADRTLAAPLFGTDFAQAREVYWIVAFWAFASALAMYLFTLTPAGRLANAVRDNPDRVAHLGHRPAAVRYRSFCVAGFFAGIAGGLLAVTYEIVGQESLTLTASGQILLATYLGGIGIFWGPILGAVLFTLLQSLVSLQTGLWQLYLGLTFVAAVLFCPKGLAGLATMHVPAWRAGRLTGLVRPYLAVLVPGALALAGLLALAELAHHRRQGALSGPEMTLAWTSVDSADPWVWALAGVSAVVGLWLARRFAPAAHRAFLQATAGPAR